MATTAGTYNGPGIFQFSNGSRVQLISGTLVIGDDGSFSINSGDNVVITDGTGTVPMGGGGAIGGGGGSINLGSGGAQITSGGIFSVGGGSLSLTGGTGSLSGGVAVATGGSISVSGGALSIQGGSVTVNSGGTGGSLTTAGPIRIASGSAQVVGGNLQLSSGPNTALNWQHFSIASSEVTQFAQAGGGAAVLNRGMQLNPAVAGSLSADGKIWLESGGHLLLARTGSGAIEPASTAATVATTSTSSGTALTAIGALPNGAHSRPSQYRTAPGTRTAWVAGDLGRDDHGARNGHLILGEIGIGYNYGSFQINAALGQTRTRQNTALNGHTHTDGNYLLVEALVPLADRAVGSGPGLTLDVYRHWGDADIRRGYLNLGIPDSSIGRPDTLTWGLRARVDWEDAATFGGFVLGPYADLGYAEMRTEGYTEVGGGFPARYDTRHETQSELRLGAVAAKPISDTAQFLTQLELAHRFQNRSAATSGEIVGMFSFDLPGQAVKQDWLRVGVGIEGRMGKGNGALMLNLSSDGNAPNAWLAASYRIGF